MLRCIDITGARFDFGVSKKTGGGGSELAALSEVLWCVSDSSVKLELSALGWE